MPDPARLPLWNGTRKGFGNLIPSLFLIVPVGVGVWRVVQGEDPIGGPLLWVGGGVALGWLATNFLGLWGNARLREGVRERLKGRGESPKSEDLFVGFATPDYGGVLDPHEDVGFLRIEPDRVRFTGERRTVALRRGEVREVRFRPNVHSLLGLGRWVSLEGVSDGKPVRLLVEPRERPTLLGNRRYGKGLRDRLRQWLAGGQRT